MLDDSGAVSSRLALKLCSSQARKTNSLNSCKPKLGNRIAPVVLPVFQMNSGSEVTPGEITEAPLNRMKPEP